MKRFFYSHPTLSDLLIGALMLVPLFGGIIGSFFLPSGPDDSVTGAQIALMAGGIAVALLVALIFHVTPVKHFTRRIEELKKLKYGRAFFCAPRKASREEIVRDAVARMEKKKMECIESDGMDARFVGLWRRESRVRTKKKSDLADYKFRSKNFYLYSVSHLDMREWESIRTEVGQMLAKHRRQLREKVEEYDIVNAVCVVADSVDFEVCEAARVPQSFRISDTLTLFGIRMCAADAGQNRYYLSAEKEERESRSNRSRALLGEVLFDAGKKVFPYRDNKLRTPEYEKALELACTETLAQAHEKESEKKRREAEEVSPYDLIFANMKEGEIRLHDDILYCIDGGRQITAGAYTPEEAAREIEKIDTDGEDIGDMEDILAAADHLDEIVENANEQEHVPSFSADYRGPLVVEIPTVSVEPRIRLLSKSTQRALCERFRTYLLSQGFESVAFWDTDKNKIV